VLDFLKHLRLHFQLVLAPVFLLGYWASGAQPDGRFLLVFLLLHVGLYGGATAYNSYYDRDEGPVGGLLHPPAVSQMELWGGLGLQSAAVVVMALFVDLKLGLLGAVMMLMGVGYSHPRLRWKARALSGLVLVACGQGLLPFFMGVMAGGGWREDLSSLERMALALISACVIVGLYPLTQVYQQDEDRARGDITFAVRFGTDTVFRLGYAMTGCGILTLVLSVGTGRVEVLWGTGMTAFLVVFLVLLRSWRRGFGRRTVYENGSWSFRMSALMAAVFWLLILAQYAGASSDRPAAEPELKVTRADGVVSVQASMWLDCSPGEVWALMTDYESLSAYMPNVESSVVLARSDSVARVRQGVHSRFVVPIRFAVTLEFLEQLPQRLRFHMVEAAVDRFSGTWDFSSDRGGTRVDYAAAIQPPAFVPSFVAAVVVRRQLRRMLPAIGAELDRRKQAGGGVEQ
jgi:1,4-dihydroxy-2-naphthoate octaprenyltransferase